MKTKIKERIENAVEAFFSNEITEQQAIAVSDHQGLSQNYQNPELAEKADGLYRLFKKAFLFLPGVLLLHLFLPGFTLFYTVGANILPGLMWLALGMVMVWLGIGDLRNKKHFWIPVPMIILGLSVGMILRFLPGDAFYYYFFLLPLFFMVPILTKGVIDKFEENQNQEFYEN